MYELRWIKKRTNGAKNTVVHPDETNQSATVVNGDLVTKIKESTIKYSKWPPEENIELIWCYYYINAKTTVGEREVYIMWRERYASSRQYLDSKKLASQRRYFVNSGRFSETEIRTLRTKIGETIRAELQNQKESIQLNKHTGISTTTATSKPHTTNP